MYYIIKVVPLKKNVNQKIQLNSSFVVCLSLKYKNSKNFEGIILLAEEILLLLIHIISS